MDDERDPLAHVQSFEQRIEVAAVLDNAAYTTRLSSRTTVNSNRCWFVCNSAYGIFWTSARWHAPCRHARMGVLVFDVIETLLDVQALDPAFESAFGDRGVRQQCFQQMLQSAFVSTVTSAYRDFSELGRAALQMTAKRRGVDLSPEQQQKILGTIRQLPPHPDVIEALGRLRDAGFRMAALTNSTAEVAEAQLQHARLRDFFEQALSADTAKRLKPAREAYHMAANRLGVEPTDLRMIAAHAWDVTGAMRAGCAAAFVARPNMVLDPAGEQPDIVGADLREIAGSIIARDRA